MVSPLWKMNGTKEWWKSRKRITLFTMYCPVWSPANITYRITFQNVSSEMWMLRRWQFDFVFFFADVGPNGTILIIRHFINNESAHDHVVHDCDWSADECHCDLIKTKIQPNPVYSQAIDRKEDNRAFYSALLHTLKSENVICAFANNEFHVSVCIELMLLSQSNSVIFQMQIILFSD